MLELLLSSRLNVLDNVDHQLRHARQRQLHNITLQRAREHRQR